MTDTTYPTRDEAIAAGLRGSQPGDLLTIHAESCACRDGETDCNCEPLTLVVGAKA